MGNWPGPHLVRCHFFIPSPLGQSVMEWTRSFFITVEPWKSKPRVSVRPKMQEGPHLKTEGRVQLRHAGLARDGSRNTLS